MLEPEEVSAILRLNELGWGAKRIAQELGISRNTAKEYIAAGGWTAYRQARRKKALDGQEAWLRERLRRHRGNADVIRQELVAEKGHHRQPAHGRAGGAGLSARACSGSAGDGAV